MGVTNLIKNQHDHAQRIAHFALDALKAAQSTFIDEENYNLGKLNLRVGTWFIPFSLVVIATVRSFVSYPFC